jgi:heme/copper-type cytochrome/quinol oxidase subunit 1
MHFLGLSGMPRRIPDYPDAYSLYNAISSYGSLVTVVGLTFFVYVLWETAPRRKYLNTAYEKFCINYYNYKKKVIPYVRNLQEKFWANYYNYKKKVILYVRNLRENYEPNKQRLKKKLHKMYYGEGIKDYRKPTE